MLELDLSTLLFQILNFLIILVGLNYLIFRPIRHKLDERAASIAERLDNAREQEAEAAKLRESWQERVRAMDREAEEIIQKAEAEARRKAARILEEARQRLDDLTVQMREDLEQQRAEIVVQHYDEILDTIIALASNVVQSVTTRRTHDDLVTNFCASIYQMAQGDVEAYRRVMANRVPTAFVATPVPLTQEQTKTVADTLSSLIDRRVELQVRVQPELIAGIQVRLADKLIDNTILNQLDRIRDRVREDLMERLGDKGSLDAGRPATQIAGSAPNR
ncbi:MAG: F0F1 ATP synthase subunit delta [Anaerolineae bacterium]|nr:F0F1 ATP synthase subunit delta [Anaerolineae bacterium]